MNQLITVKLLYIKDFYNSSHFLTSQCINILYRQYVETIHRLPNTEP